jgi:phosphoglycolate phosphatase-like HAD superfamily hydrolase
VLFDIDGTLTHSDPLHFAMCVTLDHPGTSSWQLLNVPGLGGGAFLKRWLGRLRSLRFKELLLEHGKEIDWPFFFTHISGR